MATQRAHANPKPGSVQQYVVHTVNHQGFTTDFEYQLRDIFKNFADQHKNRKHDQHMSQSPERSIIVGRQTKMVQRSQMMQGVQDVIYRIMDPNAQG